MRCFERLLGLLPSSFTQWVKFLYIKNDTLFFVFHHPCAKMEFNYKRNLIKSLLSQMSLHAPECSSLHVKADRLQAITEALAIREKDEVVLILGKGDETYQEIKGVKYPFDDRVVVRELLAKLG